MSKFDVAIIVLLMGVIINLAFRGDSLTTFVSGMLCFSVGMVVGIMLFYRD